MTDLAFSRIGKLYASTNRQGIYGSANKARSWINLGSPPYVTAAVASGSTYSGSSAGVYSLDGEGILYGKVRDIHSGAPVYSAHVSIDDYGNKEVSTNSYGEWQMHQRGGIYSVTASHDVYSPVTRDGVTVYDAVFTYVDFNLTKLLSLPIVADIPDQTVPRGGRFESISLDRYVTDGDHADSEITWRVAGDDQLSVRISNRVAYITMPDGWNGSEIITFRAVDPHGYSESNDATFMVDSDRDGEPDSTDSDSTTNDRDRDGMPDFWEEYYGTNVSVDDAGEDPDRDGLSNLEEFKAGTDPFVNSRHESAARYHASFTVM